MSGSSKAARYEAERQCAVIKAVADAAGRMPDGWDWAEKIAEADAAISREELAARRCSSGFKEVRRQLEGADARNAARRSCRWLPNN